MEYWEDGESGEGRREKQSRSLIEYWDDGEFGEVRREEASRRKIEYWEKLRLANVSLRSSPFFLLPSFEHKLTLSNLKLTVKSRPS